MKYIAILEWRIDDESIAGLGPELKTATHYTKIYEKYCVFHLSKIRRIIKQIKNTNIFTIKPINITIKSYVHSEKSS